VVWFHEIVRTEPAGRAISGQLSAVSSGQLRSGCEGLPEAAVGDDDNDGWTTDAGDCDDANAEVNPGATELCGNQVDDDCDGDVDEGCDTADSG